MSEELEIRLKEWEVKLKKMPTEEIQTLRSNVRHLTLYHPDNAELILLLAKIGQELGKRLTQ